MWDCLDGLAALLTFHSVPDCNPGTVEAFTHLVSDGRVDGSVWVSLLFCCLFSERRK